VDARDGLRPLDCAFLSNDTMSATRGEWRISAPVAYRNLMLGVVTAKGAAAVTFKEEDDDGEVLDTNSDMSRETARRCRKKKFGAMAPVDFGPVARENAPARPCRALEPGPCVLSVLIA
jgi:hypothetical protein